MVHFGHVGADEGLRAALTAHIDKGSGAVVMVNSDSGQIVNEILRSIADEYEWRDYLPAPIEAVRVAPAILDAYAGRYLVDPDRVLTMTREGTRSLLNQLPRRRKSSLRFPIRAQSQQRERTRGVEKARQTVGDRGGRDKL